MHGCAKSENEHVPIIRMVLMRFKVSLVMKCGVELLGGPKSDMEMEELRCGVVLRRGDGSFL